MLHCTSKYSMFVISLIQSKVEMRMLLTNGKIRSCVFMKKLWSYYLYAKSRLNFPSWICIVNYLRIFSVHINVSKYATGKIDLVLLSAIYSSFFFQDSLLPDKEYIFKVFRQEKSYLHQDYAVLATKIIVNGIRYVYYLYVLKLGSI